MWTEVRHHLLLTPAQDEGVCEGGHARANLDGSSAGIVHHAVIEAPAVDIPSPAGDGAVDESGPSEDEDEEGEHATTLGDGTCSNGGRGCAEL